MANLDALELNDEPLEVAHEFEVDLNCIVVVNHRFTLEGIDRSEEEDLRAIGKDFAIEDLEIMNSEANHLHTFYEDLRQAANSLAVVGLVTRFHHWTTQLVRRLPSTPRPYAQQALARELLALSETLGAGPVDVQFFKDLVTVRDSVIHGDSRSEWEFPPGNSRSIANHYRSAAGRVEISEEQLADAIKKAIQQVKWYDHQAEAGSDSAAGSS